MSCCPVDHLQYLEDDVHAPVGEGGDPTTAYSPLEAYLRHTVSLKRRWRVHASENPGSQFVGDDEAIRRHGGHGNGNQGTKAVYDGPVRWTPLVGQ